MGFTYNKNNRFQSFQKKLRQNRLKRAQKFPGNRKSFVFRNVYENNINRKKVAGNNV